MKMRPPKGKKLLTAMSCFLFAFLFFSQSAYAEETEPPIAEVYSGNLTVSDEQGVFYSFSGTLDTGFGDSATVNISNVDIPEEGTRKIQIPSSLTVRINTNTAGETPNYEEKTLTIRDVYLKGNYRTGISGISFAEGIKRLNYSGNLWNRLEDVTLPDSLIQFISSVYGEKQDREGIPIHYPNAEVPSWVKKLADASSDHIAYAGKVALWVDPEYERTSLSFKEGTRDIAWFAAMGNEKITSAVIPASVDHLGDGVFFQCKNLKSVTLEGNEITILPYLILAESGIQNFAVPSKIGKIGAYAFYKADSLKAVTFGKDAKCNYLDYRAFMESGLEAIELPAEVAYIGVECFYGTKQLKTVTFGENAKCSSLGYRAFMDSSLEEIDIPASVTMMETQVFRNATALKKVNFAKESNCSTIPYSTFKNCASLETFTLPDSVQRIDNLAFMGCAKLKEFHISEKSKLVSIGDGAFGWLAYQAESDRYTSSSSNHTPYSSIDGYSLDETGTIKPLTAPSPYGCPIEEFFIPYGVLSTDGSMPPGMFAGNTALKKAEFQKAPENAQKGGNISFKTFYGCSALENLVFNGAGNEKGIDIGTYAFAFCSNLKKVDLNGVSGLEFASFANTGLTELSIPASVKTVGTMALAGCPSMEKITFATVLSVDNAQLCSIIGQMADKENDMRTSVVPYDGRHQEKYQIFSNADYKAVYPDATAPKIIEVQAVDGKSVLEARSKYGANGFLQFMAMTEEIILGDGAKKIAENGCFGCVSLKKITLPSSLETIEKCAFYNDIQLTGIDFTKLTNLKTIGENAFFLYTTDGASYNGVSSEVQFAKLKNGYGLQEIVLPENVTQIGEYAFWGQRNAKKIAVKGENTTVNSGAFQFCNKVEEIEIATDSIDTSSWDSIFWNDRQDTLKKVALKKKAKWLSLYGLQMRELTLDSENITSIKGWKLQECTKLQKVELGEKIKTIEPLAFYLCSSMKTITLPETMETVEIAAFYKSGLEQVIILNPNMTIKEAVVTVKDPATETRYVDLFTGANVKNTTAIPEDVVIYGWKDSTAEAYAAKHGNRFVALDYTVRFMDADSETEIAKAQNLSNKIGKETYVKEPETPEKKGYYFLGWFVKEETAEGEEPVYTKFIFDQPYDNDVTVYACWAQKSASPAVLPKTSMSVENTVKTVGDVSGLPTGWSWKTEDAALKLTAGEGTTARAEYTAEDAASYETTEVQVTITRAACDAAEEILFTGKGEYAPACNKEGLGHRECKLCGDVVEVKVKAATTNHALEYHEASESSCVKYGSSAYWTCKDCHQMFADEAGTKVIHVTDLVVDKKKHEAMSAVKENKTDKTYDEVVYCKNCECELSRKKITITVAVTGIKLNKKQVTLGVGESFKIVTAITPSNATNKTVKYKSSNSSVAAVEKGTIKAKKKGTAVITVTTANNKKATIKVTIKNKPSKVSLNAAKKSLKKGAVFTLKAKLPKGTASYKMTWKSSNKKVATVSTSGKVKALKKGKAKITVTTANGKKATCTITVK